MMVVAVVAALATSSLAEPARYRCAVLANTDPMMGRLSIVIAPHPERGNVWTVESEEPWLPSFKDRRDVVTVGESGDRPLGTLIAAGTGDLFRNEVGFKEAEYIISLRQASGEHAPVDEVAILISRTETFVVAGHVEYATAVSAGVCSREEQRQP